MIQLDQIDKRILKQLIRNPRESDNGISKKTKIPVMTVNRRRKRLEESNILRYYTSLNSTPSGTKYFHVRQLYIIKFAAGITREMYLSTSESIHELKKVYAKYVHTSYLGERDGHLAAVMIIDAEDDRELVDVFNGFIIPRLRKRLGKHAIMEITTVKLNKLLRSHHNYRPDYNMEEGKISKEYSNDLLFVEDYDIEISDKSFEKFI